MAHRISRCALLALGLAAVWPRQSVAMGFGNLAPAVSGVSVSPSPLPASGTATITCSATDDASVARLSVSVNGGSLPNGTQTQELSITPGASATGSVAWATPAPGTYQVTCTAWDGAVPAASSTGVPLAVTTVLVQPVTIESFSAPAGPQLAGSSSTLRVVARDAAGGALTYSWTATAGSLVPSGATATWTAPAVGGSATIGVTATNAAGNSASASQQVTFTLSLAQGSLPARLNGPRRLAAAPDGRLVAVDARGSVWLLTARGEVMGRARIEERAVAVAASAADVYVSTAKGKILRVDAATAQVAAELPLGLAAGPSGMAFDERTGLLWLADRANSQVRALRPSGSVAYVLETANGRPLRFPTDVAIDSANGLVWVLLEGTNSTPTAHAFNTADGTWARSALPGGAAANQLARGGGIAVDRSGRLYASDLFSGRVQVLDPAGAPAGTVGSFGTKAGELRLPAGAAIMANGDLVVANSDNSRLERYGAGEPLPTCPGDSDCDGMPDDWELKYGLNPNDPSDAYLDADGDGLTNLKEYRLGTDPTKKDTDGDGLPDGVDPEPLVGSAKVVLSASAPASQGPGLVRISSVVENGTDCTATWTQVGGPEVKLRKATSLAPSFVARQAGTYRIQGVATCGTLTSAPAVVETAVENVAPRADAGRLQVVRAGGHLELDGTFSSDANGDKLALAWDQVLGPAIATWSRGGPISLARRGAGLLAFQLTARDPAGLSGSAELPVLVLGPSGFAPVAEAVSPVSAKVGGAATLDARASILGGRSAAFEWVQLEGPAVALRQAESARPSFVPSAPGHYAFQVSVVRRALRSPPARVDVYVASGAALPRAAAKLVGAPALGEPLSLDGSASAAAAGGTLGYRWRQVSGPAAGLTEADQAVATVVPFAPGAYAFELSALEGQDESQPVRLAFAVSAKGGAAPVAVARASFGRDAGERGSSGHGDDQRAKLVRLDGSASKGAIRWRWTQVGGPWVALDGGGAVATFEPQRPGTYAFELEVDDGLARSAPARVAVTVEGDCHEHDRDEDDDHGEDE